MKRFIKSLYLNYLNRLKNSNRGIIDIGEGKVQIFKDRSRYKVNIEGERVRYENYDDWKMVQTLKGKPDWLRKNWEITEDKQKKAWNFVGVKANERMLEVGFRDGFNLRYLTNIGVNISGIDVNSFAVDKAKSMDCDAYEEDIQKSTHFNDKEFDVISAIDILEHCYDAKAALKEIHRLLKDDGRVVVEIPFEQEFDANLMHGHCSLFYGDQYATRLFETCEFVVFDRDLSESTRNLYCLTKIL